MSEFYDFTIGAHFHFSKSKTAFHSLYVGSNPRTEESSAFFGTDLHPLISKPGSGQLPTRV